MTWAPHGRTVPLHPAVVTPDILTRWCGCVTVSSLVAIAEAAYCLLAQNHKRRVSVEIDVNRITTDWSNVQDNVLTFDIDVIGFDRRIVAPQRRSVLLDVVLGLSLGPRFD